MAIASRRFGQFLAACAALGTDADGLLPASIQVVVSPAAPTNLGGGTNEDWLVVLNRASTPLVYDGEPTILFQRQGQTPSNLNMKVTAYAYVTLGVSRRPEGCGLVKGVLAPSF